MKYVQHQECSVICHMTTAGYILVPLRESDCHMKTLTVQKLTVDKYINIKI